MFIPHFAENLDKNSATWRLSKGIQQQIWVQGLCAVKRNSKQVFSIPCAWYGICIRRFWDGICASLSIKGREACRLFQTLRSPVRVRDTTAIMMDEEAGKVICGSFHVLLMSDGCTAQGSLQRDCVQGTCACPLLLRSLDRHSPTLCPSWILLLMAFRSSYFFLSLPNTPSTLAFWEI